MQDNGWDHALKVTGGGTGLVGHAGAVLLRKAADQAGLTAGLSAVLGSVSPTVFPVGWLVVFGGREPVAEGDGESIQDGLPPHGPPHLAFPGGIEGPGDQVEAL
jgi:hypothetical protein